ncbi:hypothetical protein RQP46_010786 [Phenoliferia psychrophenolica]
MGNSQSILNDDILLQILACSSEGRAFQYAKKQQRERFAFGLIAKAYYRLISANSGQFLFRVDGEQQAKALVLKLELERTPAGRDGREKRPEGTRDDVTEIRRLSLTVAEKRWNSYKQLLCATPHLVALDLDVHYFTSHNQAPQISRAERTTSKQLEVALGGLQSLKKLNITFCSGSPEGIIKILAGLPGLQALELRANYYQTGSDYKALLDNLTLSRLRKLHLRLEDQFTVDLFSALVPRSNTFKALDLDWSYSEVVPYHIIKSSIKLLAWRLNTELYDEVNNPFPKFDPKLFETLATLPSLHDVTLYCPWQNISDEDVRPIKTYDADQIITYIESHESLRTLHTVKPHRWTQEQTGRVEAAARQAGVALVLEQW